MDETMPLPRCAHCDQPVLPSAGGMCPNCALNPEVLLHQIPGFELNDTLGEGGMGEVFSATQLNLDRPVALKFMRGPLAASPEFRRRFEREAKLMAQLNHPNVVTVHDWGVSPEGEPFLVMELLEGTALSKLEALEPRRAIEILIEVTDALAYLHARDIVHRDIKPANVMLTVDARVKLLDFGIAREAQTAESSITRSGQIIGTPQFMAPEARKGEEPTPAQDIYAVGVMLFWLMTDEVPAAEAWPPLPRGVEPIIRRCLARDPGARPAAAQLRAQLDGLNAAKTTSRTPGWTWAAGVLSIAAAAVIALSWVSNEAAIEEVVNEPTAAAVGDSAVDEPPPAAAAELSEEEPSDPDPTENALSTAPPGPQPKRRARKAGRRASRTVGPAAEATAVGRGTLRIRAIPWAHVRVDGAPRGKAEPPFLDLELSTGTHEISLVNPVTGGEQTRTVRVEKGKTATLRVDLR